MEIRKERLCWILLEMMFGKMHPGVIEIHRCLAFSDSSCGKTELQIDTTCRRCRQYDFDDQIYWALCAMNGIHIHFDFEDFPLVKEMNLKWLRFSIGDDLAPVTGTWLPTWPVFQHLGNYYSCCHVACISFLENYVQLLCIRMCLQSLSYPLRTSSSCKLHKCLPGKSKLLYLNPSLQK